MAEQVKLSEIDCLHKALVPILAKAAIGDFSSEIRLRPSESDRVNEILAGVDILLDVIREKNAELERVTSQLARTNKRNIEFLDDILKRPVD